MGALKSSTQLMSSFAPVTDEFGLQQIASQGLEMKSWLELEVETRWSPKQMSRILGTVGPLLLVITFLEDGLRVMTRWSEQINYLTGTRHGMGFSSWFAVLALITSIVLQIGGAMLVLQGSNIPQLKGKHVQIGGGALFTFLLLQPVMYGQHTDMDFMCRTLTLAGELALLWQHDMQSNGAKADLFAGFRMPASEANSP